MHHTYTTAARELQRLASDLASLVHETSVQADAVTRTAERAASSAVVADLTPEGPTAAAFAADAWTIAAQNLTHRAALADITLYAATLARNMGGVDYVPRATLRADYTRHSAALARANADHWHARAKA